MAQPAQTAPSALVLPGPHRQQSLSPELPQRRRRLVHPLRVEVVDRVRLGGAQEVRVGVGLHHLPQGSPEASAEWRLGSNRSSETMEELCYQKNLLWSRFFCGGAQDGLASATAVASHKVLHLVIAVLQ